MSLDINDEYAETGYFYKSSKKEIKLELESKNEQEVILVSKDWDTTQIERFVLQKNGANWTGTWVKGKGSKLAVNLTSAKLEGLTSQYDHLPFMQRIKTDNPYEYLRMKDIVLRSDSVSTYKGYGLNWYAQYGIQMFQIRSGYPKPIIDAINDSLKNIMLEEIDNKLSCSAFGGEGEYEHSFSNLYLSKNIISLGISVSYYCGGAHPDFGLLTVTYDAATGKEIGLDELISFGNTRPPKEDSDAWYDYRSQVFAPGIVTIMTTLYPKKVEGAGKDSEDDCYYGDTSLWDFPSWYLTEEGLYLGAYFPRVARMCDNPEWSVIPYEELKEIRNPDFKLALP